MRYLGVDPSLNGTGLCAVSETGEILEASTVRPPDGIRGEARLDLIERTVKAFLSQGGAFVAIESYAYHAVGDQVFQLGEVGGVVRLLSFRSEIPYMVVNPMHVKKFATGSSASDKEEMIDAAEARSGVRFPDDNQADAFFLSLVARVLADPKRAETRREMEVARRITHPPETKRPRRARKLVPNAL